MSGLPSKASHIYMISKMWIKHEDYSCEEDVVKAMEAFGISENTTERQSRNGTISFVLPFVEAYRNRVEDITFASYKSGYIRKTSGAFTCYQLNKTHQAKRMYWNSYVKRYTYHMGKERVLVHNGTDRLVMLFNYIVKNYYGNLGLDTDYRTFKLRKS